MAFEFLKNIFVKKDKNNNENISEDNFEDNLEENIPENNAENNIPEDNTEEGISEKADKIYETKVSDIAIDKDMLDEFKLAGKVDAVEGDEFADALNQLLEEDNKVELTKVDYDYIKDVAVYDTVNEEDENEKEEAIQEARAKLEAEMKQKNEKAEEVHLMPFMVVTLVVMIILVIIAGTTLFITFKAVSERKIEGDFQGEAVAQNKRSVSSANYIYTDNIQPYGEKDLRLIKVLVDSAATVFYFDGKLDMRDASFALTDDKNNNYALDLPSFSNIEFDEGITQIRFQPLRKGVNAVRLSIKGLNSGNFAEYDVIFKKPVSLPKMAYLKDKTNVKYRDDNFTVKINYLEYSGAGSRVEYSIENGEDESFDIVQRGKNNAEFIDLKENTGKKLRLWRNPIFHTFENDRLTVGRLDFSPLNDISGNTRIEIKNLYKKYKSDIVIPATNLSQGKNDKNAKELSYNLGDYKVVFEGLKKYDGAYVLVLHCEDKRIDVADEEDYSNRKEVLLDAQLIMSSADGIEINLDGASTAADYGTDMTFPINEMTADIVNHMTRSQITLNVKNVYVRVDDVSVNIDPRDLKYDKPYLRNQFENIIESAFKSRLEYKVEVKKADDITGFSDAVKLNNSIMSNYEPQANVSNVKSTVQVTAMDVENDYFYAVVMESMEYEQDGTLCYFYRTHKIRGNRTGNTWLIDQDKIIS